MKMIGKRKIGLGIAALLVLSMGLAGCGQKGDAPAGDENSGQNSSQVSGTVVIAGSTSVQPLSEELADAFMSQNKDIKIQVQGGGSGQGIKAVEDGIADLGALSREVKDEEKGSITQQIEIAKDGVAVIVNKQSDVDDLTMDQIKQIYTGEITNWNQVGGKDAPITVVSREEGSGTRGAFTEITGVLGKDGEGKEVDNTTKDALVQPSTGAVLKTVSTTPDTIGYISLGALDDSVKALKVGGVEATDDNVVAGTYKIQRPFLYVAGKPLSPATQAFVDYVLSPEGQKIVGQEFIPVK